MSRTLLDNLSDDELIRIDPEITGPNFVKRRAVLRDTVEKLSTEAKRARYHQQAAENHAQWEAHPNATPSNRAVRVIGVELVLEPVFPEIVEKNKIYIRQNGDTIEYKTHRMREFGTIAAHEFPRGLPDLTDPTPDKLRSAKASIQNIVAKRGEILTGDWGEITQHLSKEAGKIYAVLNMANGSEPGGGYLEGWGAQEENMFRRTDCHFSLTDSMMNETKSRYTPEMSALINARRSADPDRPNEFEVYFDTQKRVCIKGREDTTDARLGYPDLPDNECFSFYELRSAAINLFDNGHGGYLKTPNPFNEEIMREKIAAQLDTLIAKNIRSVVLSAFGCGAFGNPPKEVARLYKEELEKRAGKFHDVVFAVYDPGYGTDNFTPFKTVLDGLSLTQTARPSSAGYFADRAAAAGGQDQSELTDKKSTGPTPGTTQ
jgi:hypothetical protein